MSAHTKGLWAIKPEEAGVPYIRIRGTIPGEKYKVCNVHCENVSEQKEARANAHLIAAAPELLEALENLVDVGIVFHDMRSGSISGPVINKAIATIAKAKKAHP